MSDLSGELGGFKVEGIYRNIDHTVNGELEVRLLDSETKEELARLQTEVVMKENGRVMEMRKQNGDTSTVILVNNEDLDGDSIYEGTNLQLRKEDFSAWLNLWTAWMLLDMGADKVLIRDGMFFSKDDLFMEAMEENLGRSRLEEFYMGQRLELGGGISIEIDSIDGWPEQGEMFIRTVLRAQDDVEATLEGTLKSTEDGPCFALTYWTDVTQEEVKRAREAERIGSYLELLEQVGEVLDKNKRLEDGQSPLVNPRLALLYLTLRFLPSKTAGLQVWDHTDSPRLMNVNWDELSKVTEEWLKF